jgi:hypothetical protein
VLLNIIITQGLSNDSLVIWAIKSHLVPRGCYVMGVSCSSAYESQMTEVLTKPYDEKITTSNVKVNDGVSTNQESSQQQQTQQLEIEFSSWMTNMILV